MNKFQKVFLVFTIIGGLNWGSIALFNFNFVSRITNGFPLITKIIYILVGTSSIINILLIFDNNEKIKNSPSIR